MAENWELPEDPKADAHQFVLMGEARSRAERPTISDELQSQPGDAVRCDLSRANRCEDRNRIRHAADPEDATDADVKTAGNTCSQTADRFGNGVFLHERLPFSSSVSTSTSSGIISRASLRSFERTGAASTSKENSVPPASEAVHICASGSSSIAGRSVLADKRDADAKPVAAPGLTTRCGAPVPKPNTSRSN